MFIGGITILYLIVKQKLGTFTGSKKGDTLLCYILLPQHMQKDWLSNTKRRNWGQQKFPNSSE